MRTRKIDVDDRFGEEYAGTYVFKEITWAKRNRIFQRHTRYSKLSGMVEHQDLVAIQAETIVASLHGQPASKSIILEKLLSEEDDGVPFELGELFSKVVNRLCGVSRKESVFLSEQSEEANRIQQSRSTVSAKSSDGPSQSSKSSQHEQSASSS